MNNGIKCTLGPTCASIARWIRVRVKVSVKVLFRQTLDEWMGPKVHFFPAFSQSASDSSVFHTRPN